MDQKITNALRWDPYVLRKGDESVTFLASHFQTNQRQVLFIMGKGFDFRMNMALESLITSCPNINLTCFLVDYDEGKASASRKYKDFVDANLKRLRELVPESNLFVKTIDLWKAAGKKKRRVGDKNIADLFNDVSFLAPYTDIIVDISALPRGLYFSLIGKLLSLLDLLKEQPLKNLFVITSENAALDAVIMDKQPDTELSYVFGFMGGSELTSDKKPTIWFPILGESSLKQIQAAHEKVKPEEICPVLPFPSKDPRRSDSLIIEYHQLLFDELSIEGQNIIYVPEQNPFEVYRTLLQTINNYFQSLEVIKGCDVVISNFSSKLLSIGALLAAFEFKVQDSIKVGILNVDSSGYEIGPEGFSTDLIKQSELFLIWLAGEPYTI